VIQRGLACAAGVAVIGCVLTSLCFVNSGWRRAWVSRDVRAAVLRLRRDPDDRETLQSILRLAKGHYSFGATVATAGLGDIGKAASPVINEIAALMVSPNPYVRREAARSLEKLAPVSAAVLEDLARQVAKQPSDEVSSFAAKAIGANGEAALEYLPLLQSKLGTGAKQFDNSLRRAIKLLESVERQCKGVRPPQRNEGK